MLLNTSVIFKPLWIKMTVNDSPSLITCCSSAPSTQCKMYMFNTQLMRKDIVCWIHWPCFTIFISIYIRFTKAHGAIFFWEVMALSRDKTKHHTYLYIHRLINAFLMRRLHCTIWVAIQPCNTANWQAGLHELMSKEECTERQTDKYKTIPVVYEAVAFCTGNQTSNCSSSCRKGISAYYSKPLCFQLENEW